MRQEAVNLILSKAKEGNFKLLVSPAHDLEINAVDDPVERIKLQSILSEMGERTKGDMRKMRDRAEELIQLGFGVADAAHISFAESNGAEFISCDDRLIKMSLRYPINVWCGSPLAFCEKEGLR